MLAALRCHRNANADDRPPVGDGANDAEGTL